MRTTVSIDDELLREAKVAAARSGRTLSDVVTDALRVLLARQEDRGGSVTLPVFGGSGLQPGVDLEDKDGLAAVLDEAPDRAAG
ncbi:MAG TPA: ribbon-helix-helix domain-containing protein [Mycobacteriales bacterium]|nr:ribbon-helix-helix domain-containing protein [Mycobacteriales bacterium]